MKKTRIIIGIVALVLVIVIVGIILMPKKQTVKNSPVNTTQSTSNSTNVGAEKKPSTTPEPAHSMYSDAFRAKARADFIKDCETKAGSQSESVCTCTADNLGANYTDLQLTHMFLAYRSSNTIPAEIKTAYESCNKSGK